MAALHRLEKHIRKTKLKLTFAEQLGVLRNATDAVRLHCTDCLFVARPSHMCWWCCVCGY